MVGETLLVAAADEGVIGKNLKDKLAAFALEDAKRRREAEAGDGAARL